MSSPTDHRAAVSADARVSKFISENGDYRWEGIERLVYKPTGTHFRDITRQVLFNEEHRLDSQLRYFEIGAGGHSTLERHEHVHAVLILRGRGQVLLGDRIQDIDAFDTVYIPPMTWHQFRANREAPLGFLCLVACDRDRPIRPGQSDLDELSRDPSVASFIRP